MIEGSDDSFREKREVQRLVVFGSTHQRSRHLVLQVANAERARRFVAEILGHGLFTDTTVDKRALEQRRASGDCPLTIGFTYRGLQKLGLSTPYQRVFQEKAGAFVEGAYLRAARRMADTGQSAPEWWERPFRPDYAHVLLTFHAETAAELDCFCIRLLNFHGADGFHWSTPFDGCHLVDVAERTVHFGFRDGIADPSIKGFQRKGVRAPHEPGEFLLGYPNDSKFNPWLLINPWAQCNPWLLPKAHFDPQFFRNGSFGAFRKIEQHERRFRAFVDEWAREFAVTPAYVRAKISGRWDDGSVIMASHEHAPAKATSGSSSGDPAFDLNDFDFTNDRDGYGCPFGAHIRRMNPREDLVVPARKRPLIRRGMPYGPKFDESETDNPSRGLLGLFFCASLEDQFEHLLASWGNANPMGVPNRGNAKDLFMGVPQPDGTVFDIPMASETSRQIDRFERFCTTRGTLYAFFPSRKALQMVAEGASASPHAAGRTEPAFAPS